MNTELLQALCHTTGISGYEQEATDCFLDALRPCAAECSTDLMGNAMVFLDPPTPHRPRIMLEAHADEIGMQIIHISDSGYLYFRPNGGIDEQCVPGTQVVVITRKGERLPGVIGKRPIHLMTVEERKSTFKLHQLWIDTGLEPKELKELVNVGDAVCVQTNLRFLGPHRVTGKALDNRIGLFVVGEALRRLANQPRPAGNIVGVATVQEEVGCRGALVAANALNPEISLTVDVDFATDVPDCPASHYGKISLGGGVVIQRNLDCHPQLSLQLEELARQHDIPYQISARPHASGGNNASRIQLAQNGIRTVVLSIPCRYMHTPVEVCDFRDAEAAIRLIEAFCAHCQTPEASL